MFKGICRDRGSAVETRPRGRQRESWRLEDTRGNGTNYVVERQGVMVRQGWNMRDIRGEERNNETEK